MFVAFIALITDSSMFYVQNSRLFLKILLNLYIFKKSSGSIPACLRMALSVPSGISPE